VAGAAAPATSLGYGVATLGSAGQQSDCSTACAQAVTGLLFIGLAALVTGPCVAIGTGIGVMAGDLAHDGEMQALSPWLLPGLLVGLASPFLFAGAILLVGAMPNPEPSLLIAVTAGALGLGVLSGPIIVAGAVFGTATAEPDQEQTADTARNPSDGVQQALAQAY
jgi:hypothetical protein